jgi:pimeloyl-ACP methyl ester carboxylesterase
MQNFKKLITMPINMGVSCINYFQDSISLQQKPKEYEGIKLSLEEKEEKMEFEDLVTSKNYPLKINYVTTKDGYILKLYRIPGAKNEKIFEKKDIEKQSVLFIHGILDSSDGWICNDEDKCLPFILANLGYDVWLGNSRGNKHSKNHIILKPEEKEFWNFTFHEMGLYDIPAFTDHILNENIYSSKLIYIGHSQGTTQMFCALSENYQYIKKNIKLFIALGPVAKLEFLDSILINYLCNFIYADQICLKLGFNEFFSFNENLNKAGSWVLPKFPKITNLIMDLISDKDSYIANNQKKMSVYVSRLPSGCSLKAILHLSQLYRSKKFCAYDEGPELNKKIYGNEYPKEYNLNFINEFPIVIINGKLDRLSNPKDVEWLLKELGENVIYKRIYEDMGHSSFMMANDVKWFDDIINIMNLHR